MTTRAFEIRHFTDDPTANGESDFIGPTSVLDTNERVAFLRAFATTARRFFGNERWDRLAVPPDHVTAALARLKPQPRPQVRRRIAIDRWLWLVCRDGIRETDAAKLAYWQGQPGLVATGGGTLGFAEQATATFVFPLQAWRFLVRLRLKRTASAGPLTIAAGEALTIGPQALAAMPADTWTDVRCEVAVDADARCANVEVDGRRVLAAQPLAAGGPVDRVQVTGAPGWEIGDCWVQSYAPHWEVHGQIPIAMQTVLDETFRVRPDAVGWQSEAYDDSCWDEGDAPFSHGGERHRGEDLYLRRRVDVPATGRVWLNIETLFPGGEVWVNGRVVHVQHDPRPVHLDITPFVRHGETNLLAIRVFPFQVARHIAHGSHDRHSGWFAGRTWIDVTTDDYIDDVFVTTARLGDEPALHARVTCNSAVWGPDDCRFGHNPARVRRVRLRVRPWYPEEGPVVAEAVREAPLVYFNRPVTLDFDLPIPDGQPWSPGRPFLYRVDAVLETAAGELLDDMVVTTGLRVVGQRGGVFHLNNRPALLCGGLLFGMRPPLEEQARILRCAPLEHLVREVLLAKGAGGNCIRMSVHEGTYLGCNDPRFAEIGDQLGLCFLWSTTAWVRTASAWQLDTALLQADARLVRNHPSIVMWQPGNHPKFFATADGLAWWRETFRALLAVDDSRLICPFGGSGMMDPPSDDGTRLRDGAATDLEPTWTHPLAARGDFETPTGYAKGWEYLREWPEPKEWESSFGWTRGAFKREYLNSPTHAWFDFESEETIGQPNWDLLRGSPVWHVWSYEHRYDERAIGRLLGFEEWEISQAWQGLSAAEAYRKKRLLDYDGMFWCCLDGGGNTGTYQKPLTDHLGHAKIAYHVLRMVFQPTFAGSGNVDISYGPGDVIPVRVIHCGPAGTVDVVARIRTPAGELLVEQRWPDIRLPAGRAVVPVADWQPPRHLTGILAVEYEAVHVAAREERHA